MSYSQPLQSTNALAKNIISCDRQISGTESEQPIKCRHYTFVECLQRNGVLWSDVGPFFHGYNEVDQKDNLICRDMQVVPVLIVQLRSNKSVTEFKNIVQLLCSQNSANWTSQAIQTFIVDYQVKWPITLLGNVFGFQTTITQSLEVVLREVSFLLRMRLDLCKNVLQASICVIYYMDIKKIRTNAVQISCYNFISTSPSLRNVEADTKAKAKTIHKWLFSKQAELNDKNFGFSRSCFKEIVNNKKFNMAATPGCQITSAQLTRYKTKELTNSNDFSQKPTTIIM